MALGVIAQPDCSSLPSPCTPIALHHVESSSSVNVLFEEATHDATGLSDHCSKLWLCKMTVLLDITVIRRVGSVKAELNNNREGGHILH